MIRRIAHAAIVMVGVVPWLLAYGAMCLVAGCAVLADKVMPGAAVGNCWSYAVARCVREGGFMCIRPVKGASILRFFPIMHATWAADLRGGEVRCTVPLRRVTALWLPWRTFFFAFRVRRIDESKPGPWHGG